MQMLPTAVMASRRMLLLISSHCSEDVRGEDNWKRAGIAGKRISMTALFSYRILLLDILWPGVKISSE